MPARLTQVVAEAARGNVDGAAFVTQVVVETVQPFVAGSGDTYAVSAAAAVVAAPRARAGRGRPAAATASVVATALGKGFHGIYRESAVAVVVSAAAALTNLSRGVVASALVVVKARAKNRFLPVVFGDTYLGRFQAGQEVPLWCLVRDQHGAPTPPTVSPPVAEVYDLDARRHAGSAELHRLAGARSPAVYVHALRLGVAYPPARYGVLYRAPAGGFVGYSVAVFEVVPGGDAAGPVLAAHTLMAAAGDQVVAQLGSGALAKGSRPRVP